MKKIVIAITLIISCMSGFPQSQDLDKYVWYRYSYGIRYPRIQTDSVFGLPLQDTTWTPDTAGVILMKPSDKKLYYFDGTIWVAVGSGSSTGSTNSNIGSAYRWAIPGTNNIKTFAVAWGATIDSITSGTLTLTFDSTHAADKLLTYGEGRRWIDSLANSGATIDNYAGGGFNILNFHTDPDFVYAKYLVAGDNIVLDSTAGSVTINGPMSLSSLTDDVDVTSSPPSSDDFYLGYNYTLGKWVARENAVIYPILDGDSLRIVSTSGDTSSGVFIDGGGGGCATCWLFDDETTVGAQGIFGTLDNYGIDIKTNNTKRGEITNGGGFIWKGASLTGGLSAAFADSTGLDYLRMGGVVTPFSGAIGLNSRIVIKGAGATSTTGGITYVNSTPATVFAARDDGSISMPFVFSSITANGLRFTGTGGGATGISIQPGNTAGISGNLISISNFTAQSNIGATTSSLLRLAGTYQEITPYDDAGNYRVLVNDFTFNGTAGKGPGYVAGYESEVNQTDIPNYRSISILDSGYIYHNGAVHFAQIKTPATSGDYTVVKEDYFIYLNDLTTPAANRNVVMSAPLTNGRMLIVFNTNADATYKWSFSGTTVKDAAGTTVTTLTDGKCYTLIYHLSEWKIISVY